MDHAGVLKGIIIVAILKNFHKRIKEYLLL